MISAYSEDNAGDKSKSKKNGKGDSSNKDDDSSIKENDVAKEE
jgi:hypothetical protein